MVEQQGEVKKFYCASRDVCAFKNHYLNNRCWANYQVRATCPNLATDKETIEALSKEVIDWKKRI